MKRKSTTLAIMAFSVIATVSSQGAIIISALNTASLENFNSMNASATATAPSGMKMTSAGDATVSWNDAGNLTATTQQASSGSPVTGGRYNWGQTASDRSLGFMTSGSYASPNSIMADITNSTGATITVLNLAFDYERFRINSAAASVAFFTSTDGSTWTARTAGDSGAFTTGTSAYNFATGTVVSKSFSLTGLSIAAGSDFYLRWAFDTTGSNSQGIGLDNLSVTAVPEPSAALLGGLGMLALLRRRR